MEKSLLLQGVNTLEQRLKKSDRMFTLGDAAAITGYTIDQAKETLDALMSKYDCRLKVTENGDLIYDFGQYLHARGERTWAEWWHGAKQWLWKAFMIFFKVWISITLVVYFVIFLVILIAFIVAMMAKNDDNSSSSSDTDLSGAFVLIGDVFRSIFWWNTITGRTYYDRDPYGYPYQRYEPRPSSFGRKKKSKGKNFVSSVYDFVFGPPRVEMSPLANQQEVAAYLRKNKGLVVIPEIVGLAGWKADEAEDFFTEVLIRYKGDSKISENSILYGDFYELARTKTDDADAKITWYWDEYEPDYQLTGNTSGRNTGVIFMNLFNLAMASFFTFGAPAAEFAGGLVFLGWIPFVFSFIFFLVPTLRYFQIQPLRRKRHMENIRKRLMKVIFSNASNEIPMSYLQQTVNSQKKEEENLSKESIEKMMHQLISDLYGEIAQNTQGEIIYRFPRLQEELQEVKRLRDTRDSGRNLGDIVFDSHE